MRYVRLGDDSGFLSFPEWGDGRYVEGDDCDLFERAMPLLREGATRADLAAALDEPASRVDALLDALRESGAFADRISLGADAPLLDETVGVLAPGTTAGADLPFRTRRLADPAALATADVDAALTLTVEERPSFQRSVAEHASVPWLPARVVGSELWLGPTFAPTTSPCYDCYERRVFASVPDEEVARAELAARAEEASPGPLHASLLSVSAAFLAASLRSSRPAGTFVRLDPLRGRAQSTVVRPTPGCDACETSRSDAGV